MLVFLLHHANMYKLGKLLRPALDCTDRSRSLQELFVKGYRVGFRMRMEKSMWMLDWPTAGLDFDMDSMVNEARLLHGTVSRTFELVAQAPSTYGVLFGLSPTIKKWDPSAGTEVRIVHRAMVIIAKKSMFNYIGAERAQISL